MISLPCFLLLLPSPPTPVIFGIGPLTVSYFGLFVVLGIILGTWMTGRQLERLGYQRFLAIESLLFAVPCGVVGARLYYVLSEYAEQYASNPFPSVIKIWEGGLGLYGAVAGGFVGLFLFCRIRGISTLAFADAAAPGLALGQAVGRLGNYFNQELFGGPSDLPWAVYIAPQNRPVGFADVTSFHPTFFYEALWDALVCLVLLVVARRFSERLRAGDVFMLSVVLYSIGHLLVGTLRLDGAFVEGGYVRSDLLLSVALTLFFTFLLVGRTLRSRKLG